MSIIDSIRLSGTTYQIQGEVTVDAALNSGSTNPVANSAITTALDDKVNVVDNNVSAYTFENKIGGAVYGYSEHFAGPIYISYTDPTTSGEDYYAGSILCYTSEWAWEYIYLYFNLSDGQITATTVSSSYLDIEIENGEAVLTFKDGYYLRKYDSQNGFIALTKTVYESGQSADVIEDTVYDVFDKLNDKIDIIGDNVVIGSNMTFRDGYLDLTLSSNRTSFGSTVKIDSSTIKSDGDGLSVQFATPEVADKILNVGSGSYGQLFSTSSYDTSFNEFTITFNQNCTQYSVYHFNLQIRDTSDAIYNVSFEYDSADMSAEYTDLSTYCTVTDTLSTDYKLKVAAKEGYKISFLYNSEYMVGGVDNTNPNNYISNLVTTPSYVHDGQDVIDDIYDKLDDKQDTLVSGTNIKTINNQSILGSGNIDIQGGSVTVDSALSPTSENPVQNKVIYSKIDEVEEVTAAGLNALNDKITPTVELTQAEYDALTTKDPNTYYIITDAQAGDLTNYYTKSETNTLLGGKQATLVSGTNIKTINNESLLGSGNIDIQGGSTYTAGRGISIANDTISFSLPISAGTGSNSIIENSPYNKATSNYTHAEGHSTSATNVYSHAEGYQTLASGQYAHAEGLSTTAQTYCHSEGYQTNANASYSHAEGYQTLASGSASHTEGGNTSTSNSFEHASGYYNVSNKANTTFGNSGNTLFSVGNGTANNARHNAFEIRQNGDIYLTKDGQDVKLQDQLGGGGTVDQTIISGSTNAVAGGAVYNKIDEVEQVTARALNELNDNFGGLKLVKLTEAEYNALATKDSSTLYIIVN